MLSNKQHEFDEMKKKCQQLEIHAMEMKNCQQQIGELESKVALLSQELVRLNEVLRDKEDAIHGYKKLEYELNLKLKQQNDWQH